jgi:hypothetical protein
MPVKRELKVTVQRRGGLDRDHVVEMVVRRVLGEIASPRLANTLRITVECRATKLDKKTDGTAYWEPVEDPRMKEYRIVVQRDADLRLLAETIAHEVRHVVQFARGQLRYGTKGGVYGAFWRAGAGEATFYPKATTDYWTSPWEVEARATEALGVKAISRMRAA